MVQCQILNKIIQTKDSSIILLNNLTADYFSDYGAEFNFIKTHIDAYGVVPDPATFIAAFPDFDYIEVKEPTAYLLDELVNDYNKRHLASVFTKVKHLVEANKVEEAMSYYVTESQKVSKAISLQTVDITKDTSRYDAYVERANDFSKFYVKTGFKEIDAIIGGWDRQEELATIVARPGVGKTWLLLKCAVAAAEQGLKVGIYSGEMSDRKVGYRFDTLVSHISNSGIMRGVSSLSTEYKQYMDSLSTRFKSGVKVLTPNMINGAATVTALRAFIEKEELDILFVDQHSLLEDQRGAKNPVDRASNISRDLKQLQVLKKIPIISVSQQNRESTENGVSTANVAQTDRISQDSTILIFIEQKDSVMTLTLGKSRDSVTGKRLSYAVDLDHGIFDYIPEENNGVSGAGSEELRREFEGDEPF